MPQSQHIQKALNKIWDKFPMLNFSRQTPTLGWFFSPDTQKVLKIAHFGIFRHIGGVGWVRKHMDPKIQWVNANCSKNCGSWTSWGPTIIFSEKKPRTFELLYTQTQVYDVYRFMKVHPLLPPSTTAPSSSILRIKHQ